MAASASSDPAVAELTERLAALEAENEALRDSLTAAPRSATPTKRSWWRTPLATALVIVGLVLGTTSIVTAYANTQLLDTDRFVATFAPLADDPAVQDVVGTAVSQAITESVDIPGLTADLFDGIRSLELPPRAESALTLLEAPAAQGLQSLVDSAVDDVVRSDAFSAVWDAALLATHTQLMATVTNSSDALLVVDAGALSLQIGPIVAEVRERLVANGVRFAEVIPTVDRSVVLVENASLDLVHTGYALIAALGTWLPWVALALLAAGVLVARHRRRALIVAAISSSALMVLLALALSVTRAALPGAIIGDRGILTAAAIHSVFDGVTAAISATVLAIGVLGVCTALVAWMSGPGRVASGVRDIISTAARASRTTLMRRGISTGGVGRWLDAQHRVILIGIALIAAAIILFTRPLSGSVIVWTVLFSALLVVILQFLRSPSTADSSPLPTAPADPAEQKEHTSA